MAEVPQSTVWYFRYLGESWMKLASKQPWLSPDQIQRQLWEQWIHGQASGGRDANTNNGTGCDAEVQHGAALRQGDKREAGLFSHPSEGMVPSRELAAPSQASPSPPSISPQPDIPLYRDQPKTAPSGVSPSFVKDAEVTSSFAGGPILKHEEDQDQGFLLLLDQLAPVLERDGPMNKEQATLMVRRKWAEMGVAEKDVWRNLVGKGENGEIQAGSATAGSRTPKKDKEKEVSRDTVNKGKKREAQGQGGKVRSVTSGSGSSTPNKGTKLVTSVKVKRAINEKKTSPTSSPRPLINSVPNSESAGNNLSICKKDITDNSTGKTVNKIVATEDSGCEDEGMQHLMTHLVPKLMEGGVPNLEVAQAMVTKKWGEMRVEERASWIQMARSIRMQKDAELKPKPEPKRKGPTIAHVASDKINTEGASKQNPNIASPYSPAVNHSEHNLKESTSPQASENSPDMNFNSIEAAAVNNEARKVEESSPNEDGGAAAVPNAEEINESANGPSSQDECRNSTMEAIASSSREAASENKSEKFVDSKLGQKRESEDDVESGSAKKKEKVEPGLIYLLAKLTTEMMKRGGVQTKEEAEQLVRDKWKAMSAEEKDVWTHLVQEENPHEVN